MKRDLLVALSTILSASCVTAGDGGPFSTSGTSGFDEDTVFLYVLNAFPGADTITVRGPGGVLADDLRYGQRMAEDGRCPADEACVPIAVSRVGLKDFRVQANGETVGLDLREELAGFYPHETGTLIVRGGGELGIDAMVVRHPQTVSSGCELAIVNALSVDGPDGDNFSVAVETKLSLEEAGYRDETAEPILTRCGELPTDSGQHEALARPELRQRIEQNPWFLTTACDGPDCLAWGEPGIDERATVSAAGTAAVHPSTDDYRSCLRDAITVSTDTCPQNLSWDDVTIDQLAAADCATPRQADVALTSPGRVATQYSQGCEATFRLRTPELDRIFGPHSRDPMGRHQDGELLLADVQIPSGDRYYWVLMGRPVNPTVWQWSSADSFVDLGFFPYPGDGKEGSGTESRERAGDRAEGE